MHLFASVSINNHLIASHRKSEERFHLEPHAKTQHNSDILWALIMNFFVWWTTSANQIPDFQFLLIKGSPQLQLRQERVSLRQTAQDIRFPLTTGISEQPAREPGGGTSWQAGSHPLTYPRRDPGPRPSSRCLPPFSPPSGRPGTGVTAGRVWRQEGELRAAPAGGTWQPARPPSSAARASALGAARLRADWKTGPSHLSRPCQ